MYETCPNIDVYLLLFSFLVLSSGFEIVLVIYHFAHVPGGLHVTCLFIFIRDQDLASFLMTRFRRKTQVCQS